MTVRGAIAVVRRGGRILIAKRPAGKHLAGYWEFPGGRIERGETPEDTVKRELLEETALRVKPVSRGRVIAWNYGFKSVRLFVVHCTAPAGRRARPLACDAVRWVRPSELGRFRFPPANAKLVAELRRGGSVPPSRRARGGPGGGRGSGRGATRRE